MLKDSCIFVPFSAILEENFINNLLRSSSSMATKKIDNLRLSRTSSSLRSTDLPQVDNRCLFACTCTFIHVETTIIISLISKMIYSLLIFQFYMDEKQRHVILLSFICYIYIGNCFIIACNNFFLHF